MKRIVLFTLLFLVTTFLYAQKLKGDAYTIVLKDYEITKKVMPIVGIQETVKGSFEILKKKESIATYKFKAPLLGDEVSSLEVIGKNEEKLEPKLNYLVNQMSYTFYKGTDKEGKEKVLKTGKTKNIILSGLLIWTKQRYSD